MTPIVIDSCDSDTYISAEVDHVSTTGRLLGLVTSTPPSGPSLSNDHPSGKKSPSPFYGDPSPAKVSLL